jgi:hypothetical protein
VLGARGAGECARGGEVPFCVLCCFDAADDLVDANPLSLMFRLFGLACTSSWSRVDYSDANPRDVNCQASSLSLSSRRREGDRPRSPGGGAGCGLGVAAQR